MYKVPLMSEFPWHTVARWQTHVLTNPYIIGTGNGLWPIWHQVITLTKFTFVNGTHKE